MGKLDHGIGQLLQTIFIGFSSVFWEGRGEEGY